MFVRGNLTQLLNEVRHDAIIRQRGIALGKTDAAAWYIFNNS